MDGCQQPWSSLPDELAFNIFARLPVVEILRIRTVCKRWNQLAADEEFRRLRPSLCRPRSGFALFLTNAASSYMLYLDLNAPDKWRMIPFSFLPEQGPSLMFLASSRGLLLLGTQSRELLVVNPVTKGWRKLPALEGICDLFYTALTVDATTGDFVVVVAESELSDTAVTEVFESKTGRWRVAASPSRAGRWKQAAAMISRPWFYGTVPVCCKPVYCDGAFYHLTWDLEEMVSEFTVAKGVWRCAKGDGMVPDGVPWGVMEVGGKVVLVVMSYPNASGWGRGGGAGSGDAVLCLWELRRESLEWALVASIPAPPRSDLRVDKWRRFAVGDGCVCTTFLLPGTVVTFDGQSDAQPGMIYDCATTAWLPMPDLPGTPWGSVASLFNFSAALHAL